MYPCKNCLFGGYLIYENGTSYVFKKAIKADPQGLKVEINYKEGGKGCRASYFQKREDECLNNNFNMLKVFSNEK